MCAGGLDRDLHALPERYLDVDEPAAARAAAADLRGAPHRRVAEERTGGGRGRELDAGSRFAVDVVAEDGRIGGARRPEVGHGRADSPRRGGVLEERRLAAVVGKCAAPRAEGLERARGHRGAPCGHSERDQRAQQGAGGAEQRRHLPPEPGGAAS